MATAVIIDDYRNRSTVPRVVNYPITKITYSNTESVIIDDYENRSTTLTAVNYPITKINYSNTETIAQSILPFRVRFTSIGIEGYSSSNPPGIGLQVIGFSNWII
jgi:hypothetical protein